MICESGYENFSVSTKEEALKDFKIKERKRLKLRKKETKKEYKEGKWDKEEHQDFIQACHKYGNNWAKVKIIFLFFF